MRIGRRSCVIFHEGRRVGSRFCLWFRRGFSLNRCSGNVFLCFGFNICFRGCCLRLGFGLWLRFFDRIHMGWCVAGFRLIQHGVLVFRHGLFFLWRNREALKFCFFFEFLGGGLFWRGGAWLAVYLVRQARDRALHVGLAFEFRIHFGVQRIAVIADILDHVLCAGICFDGFGRLFHLSLCLICLSFGINIVQTGEQRIDRFFSSARMAACFEIELADELCVGATVLVQFIGEVIRRAGLYFAAQRIRQQHGAGIGRQSHPIPFGIVRDLAVLAFLPGHFLLVRHLAELIDQPFCGWMQHQVPPFRLAPALP